MFKNLNQVLYPKNKTIEAQTQYSALLSLNENTQLQAAFDAIERDFYEALKASYRDNDNKNRDYYAAGLNVIDTVRSELKKKLKIYQNSSKMENVNVRASASPHGRSSR